MSKINNSETTQEIIKAARLASAFQVPTELGNAVVPVVEVNPRLVRTANITRSQTATYSAATIYTTPTNQDFYLCSVTYSISKDVVSDAPTSGTGIRIVVDGANRDLALLSMITLTAQTLFLSYSLPFPIKVDRNTNITIPSITGSLGVVYRSASITGYTVESSQA